MEGERKYAEGFGNNHAYTETPQMLQLAKGCQLPAAHLAKVSSRVASDLHRVAALKEAWIWLTE